MSVITEFELKEQIRLNNFKRAYLIYGEEKYLVKYYTNLLTSEILQGDNSPFNLQNFFSPELDIDKLNSSIESLPLLSPVKCVRVFDLDVEKESVNTTKKLKEIISNLPETTVLIIALTSITFDLKRAAKWSSFIQFFERYGEVLNLPLLSNSKLRKQLIKWAEKLSCSLLEKNAQVIIDKCGNDLFVLKNELEKLCAFVNKGEITTEIINNLVLENFETNVFDLTKSIINKDYRCAFKILNTLLLNKEDPIAILAVMTSNYIDLYRIKAAEQSAKDIYDIAKIFDYKRKMFRLENAKKYSKNISEDSLRNCINILIKTDYKLKSSKIDSKILLEKLIVNLINC